MSEVINLSEYRHAKQLTEDFPKIKKSLDECLKVLYNYSDHTDVMGIIWAINEHELYLTSQYEYYKTIYKPGVLNDTKS